MDSILREISRWPIEAKDDDTDRYFFHFDDVERIESGLKNFVIGRKGTGKTAIAEYLHRTELHNRFSKLLSFKNFPFNSLYSLSDSDYNRPNQYITIWKYVILNYICAMMADNSAVCSRVPFDLKKVFRFEVQGALSGSVKVITSREYSLSVLGVGGGVAKDEAEKYFDFVQANSVLISFINKYIDECEYYVIFDELDEDYRDVLNPDRREKYFELLISLFKATQSIRGELRAGSVRPVIFLRDDIFDLCRDNDKNKWLDRAVVLKWGEPQLRRLLNYRLSRACEVAGHSIDPDAAWDAVFAVRRTRYGHKARREEDTLRFILSRTFLRPRDLVSYVRECANYALSLNFDLIDNSIIKEAGEAHSSYMRREIIDEMFPVLDDISEILDVLSRMGKIIFTKKEFQDRYREYQNQLPKASQSDLSEAQILKLLFHFNVVGNIGAGQRRFFSYNSDAKVLNLEKPICIHNGLLRTLDIY